MEKGRGREEFLFNPKDWFTTVYLCSQIHQRLVLLACYTLIFFAQVSSVCLVGKYSLIMQSYWEIIH